MQQMNILQSLPQMSGHTNPQNMYHQRPYKGFQVWVTSQSREQQKEVTLIYLIHAEQLHGVGVLMIHLPLEKWAILNL